MRKDLFAKAGYVGFDIARGPNVDVVGDAHELSRHFPADHFDAVFALSVFEHLAMPAAPDARLRWDVPLGEVLSTSYPA